MASFDPLEFANTVTSIGGVLASGAGMVGEQAGPIGEAAAREAGKAGAEVAGWLETHYPSIAAAVGAIRFGGAIVGGLTLVLGSITIWLAGSASVYRDCLKVSKGEGYLLTFAPLLVSAFVMLLAAIDVPADVTEAVATLLGICVVSVIGLATLRTWGGKCSI